VAGLPPGSTEAEISERLTQIDAELPAEAHALFTWRNGTTHPASAVPHRRAIGIAYRAFWSLDDLVAWYAPDWNQWHCRQHKQAGEFRV
jgi:hypothetical protein